LELWRRKPDAVATKKLRFQGFRQKRRWGRWFIVRVKVWGKDDCKGEGKGKGKRKSKVKRKSMGNCKGLRMSEGKS
jgi:hypothetical protein